MIDYILGMITGILMTFAVSGAVALAAIRYMKKVDKKSGM